MYKEYTLPSTKVLDELSDYFGIDVTGVRRHIRNGIPMEELYNVLENKVIPRGMKKKYLYGLKLMNTTAKDNIWERFIGDKGFKYDNKSVFMQEFRKYQIELRKEGFNL